MTINQNELLSALVDDELQGSELDNALQIVATDKEAKAQFQRYQQAKDILKGYTERGLSNNLVDRISNAIENEAVYSLPETQQKAKVISFAMPYWKQLTGLAVAASIGALAVVGVMTQPQHNLITNSPMATAEQSHETMKVAQTTGERWTVDEPEVAHRLNNYLLDHNELTSSPGVFSYARVVSYGTE